MVAFNEVTLPFIDTVAKAEATVRQINDQGATDGARPLIFSTLVNQDIAAVVSKANALFLDCFDIFIRPMEKELGVAALHAVGKSHSANDFANYHHRIEAVNYSLGHDDGATSSWSAFRAAARRPPVSTSPCSSASAPPTIR
mgnify:CR=1 FL=1